MTRIRLRFIGARSLYVQEVALPLMAASSRLPIRGEIWNILATLGLRAANYAH